MTSDPQSSKKVDVLSQRVAAVYAKAFLGAAEAQGQTDELVSELGALVDEVLDKHPDFGRVLGSLLISPDEKVGLIDRTLGKQASPALVVFLKVLATHGRLELIRPIRTEVGKQFNVLRGRVAMELRTATPPDEALRKEVTNRMRQIVGGEPQLSVVVDPALLGGLVVTVGDRVFDGSIATHLRQMRAHIIAKNVEHIETNRQRFLEVR